MKDLYLSSSSCTSSSARVSIEPPAISEESCSRLPSGVFNLPTEINPSSLETRTYTQLLFSEPAPAPLPSPSRLLSTENDSLFEIPLFKEPKLDTPVANPSISSLEITFNKSLAENNHRLSTASSELEINSDQSLIFLDGLKNTNSDLRWLDDEFEAVEPFSGNKDEAYANQNTHLIEEMFSSDLKILTELSDDWKLKKERLKQKQNKLKFTKFLLNKCKDVIECKYITEYFQLLGASQVKIFTTICKSYDLAKVILLSTMNSQLKILEEKRQFLEKMYYTYCVINENDNAFRIEHTYTIKKLYIDTMQNHSDTQAKLTKTSYKLARTVVSLAGKVMYSLKVVTEIDIASPIKSFIIIYEKTSSVWSQTNNLKYYKQSIDRLKPFHVHPSLNQGFNDLLKDLKELENYKNITERKSNFTKLKKKLAEAGIPWGNVPQSHEINNLMKWEKHINDEAFTLELFKQYQAAKLAKTCLTFHSSKQLTTLLSKRNLMRESQKHEARLLIDKMTDNLEGQPWNSACQQNIEQTLEYLNLSLPSISTWDKMDEESKERSLPPVEYLTQNMLCHFSEQDKQKLTNKFLEVQEVRGLEVKRQLQIWITIKNKIEHACSLFDILTSGVQIGAEFGNLAILALGGFTFTKAFLIPMIAEFQFVGAWMLPWVLPTLFPSVLGTMIFTAGLCFAYYKKPALNDFKGLSLKIEYNVKKSAFEIIDYYNNAKYYSYWFVAKTINASCPQFILSFFNKADGLVIGSNPDKVNRHRLQELSQELEQRAFEELFQNLGYSPQVIESLGSHPLSIIQHVLNTSHLEFFSPEVVEFFNRDLGINLLHSQKQIRKLEIEINQLPDTEENRNEKENKKEQILTLKIEIYTKLKTFFNYTSEDLISFYQRDEEYEGMKALTVR